MDEIQLDVRRRARWTERLIERNSLNQNFLPKTRKFLSFEWIALGPNGVVPFHSQNDFCAH